MKIGLVIDDSLDSSDGVQQYVLTLGTWLSNQGHEVHYITSTTKRPLPNIHSVSKKVTVRFNKNIMCVPLPASTRKISKLLHEKKFDIIHVQMPFSPLLSGRLIHVMPAQTALVGTFHVAPFARKHYVAGKLLAYLTKIDTQRFDELLSVSRVAQDYARSAFNLNTRIIPNVIDVGAFKSKIKNKPGRIVFVGRLVPRKGCAQLLAASRLLAMRNKNFELIIIGKGPEQAKLQHYVSLHGLDHRVTFKGFVSEHEKRDLLASASIATFPALGGESFGIVLLEAMSAGSGVVLAGNNLGYKSVLESVPESIVAANDEQAFSYKLEKLLSDQHLCEKIHKAQQKIVKQYDIHTVGPKIINVYQQAIEKRRNPVHNTN